MTIYLLSYNSIESRVFTLNHSILNTCYMYSIFWIQPCISVLACGEYLDVVF